MKLVSLGQTWVGSVQIRNGCAIPIKIAYLNNFELINFELELISLLQKNDIHKLIYHLNYSEYVFQVGTREYLLQSVIGVGKKWK